MESSSKLHTHQVDAEEINTKCRFGMPGPCMLTEAAMQQFPNH